MHTLFNISKKAFLLLFSTNFHRKGIEGTKRRKLRLKERSFQAKSLFKRSFSPPSSPSSTTAQLPYSTKS